MARIRSVHPGLFTDESFMTASMPARLLLIGLWTECFDDGVFEWKPVTIKARIFPADNIDVKALLLELVNLAFIKMVDCDGKKYGLVRNFRKYQRPKKPNSSGILNDELRTYVALRDDGSELVENQFDTYSEIPQQMEDGGGVGRVEEVIDKSPAQQPYDPAAAPLKLEIDLEEARQRCEKANHGEPLKDFQAIIDLLEAGISLERRILPVIIDVLAKRTSRRDPPVSWKFFLPAIRDSERVVKPLPAPPAKPGKQTFFVKVDTPQWEAWRAYSKRTNGRGYNPHNGGWYFDSEWPPDHEEVVEAAE